MTEVKRKICMIGDFAVGKTSLVRRYVNSIYTDKYLTTVGVKIDTKSVQITDTHTVKLVVWDIAGDSEITTLSKSYMTGMAGYVLVADSTRPSTFEAAIELNQQVQAQFGSLPFVFLLNKSDLIAARAIPQAPLQQLSQQGIQTHDTSAKTGDGVEEMFFLLGEQLIAENIK